MNWSYIAGFTDGDGCITLETSKGKYRYARIRWSQRESTSDVLDAIYTFLVSGGFKVSMRNFSVARKGHLYPQRELSITNAEDTRRVLHELEPFLVLKKERCREALRIMDEVHGLKKQYGTKYRAHMTPEALACLA